MLRIVRGSILDANEDIIAHQVNCFGVMGAGVAKQIADAWPECYQEYKKLCDVYGQSRHRYHLLGRVCWYVKNPDIFIANIFGQYKYGRSTKTLPNTDYEALRKGLTEVAGIAIEDRFSIAIPYGIGCGLGGGDWDGVVFPMLTDIFCNETDNEYRKFKDLDVVLYQLS